MFRSTQPRLASLLAVPIASVAGVAGLCVGALACFACLAFPCAITKNEKLLTEAVSASAIAGYAAGATTMAYKLGGIYSVGTWAALNIGVYLHGKKER